MNAHETASTLYPKMPIPTDLIAELMKAARTEELFAVLVAAYKLGFQQGVKKVAPLRR
jgi:hypothetical protein